MHPVIFGMKFQSPTGYCIHGKFSGGVVSFSRPPAISWDWGQTLLSQWYSKKFNKQKIFYNSTLLNTNRAYCLGYTGDYENFWMISIWTPFLYLFFQVILKDVSCVQHSSIPSLHKCTKSLTWYVIPSYTQFHQRYLVSSFLLNFPPPQSL
jgi:hypothetical protein